MGKLRVGIIVMVLLHASTVFSASQPRLAEIQKFSEPLKLGQVMQTYSGWTHGHGPYIWYKSGELAGKEVWFWFERPDKEIPPSEYEIVLITIVDSKNPDNLEIVWPKRYVNEDIKRVFDSIYKNSKPNHSLQSDRANSSVEFLSRVRKVLRHQRIIPAAELGRYPILKAQVA